LSALRSVGVAVRAGLDNPDLVVSGPDLTRELTTPGTRMALIKRMTADCLQVATS